MRSSQSSAAEFLPPRFSLTSLRKAVAECRGCDLYRNATQAVFGEGPRGARLMVVGEQPGDQEDQQGHPFVGPAGKLLFRAIDEAGLDRAEMFVTNAVKHFKFERRGKWRIHAKPSPNEVRACNPWLEAEIEVVQPELVLALGRTAAKAVFGSDLTIARSRGRVLTTTWAGRGMVTVHPSAVLRAPDDEGRKKAYAGLVKDLRAVARALKAA